MKKQPIKAKRITFRLPHDLARKVDDLRTREGRTLNTQLVRLVQKGLDG